MKASKPKSTAIEIDKRLFTIYGWLLEGVPDRLIVQQILQTYPIGIRQAERYVVDAYKKYKKIEGINIEAKREIAIAGLKQDIRSLRPEFKGTPAGLRAVNAIKKEITKLEGIELPKHIDITTKGESLNYRPIFGELDSVFENDKANDSE
jgi:hypothetical protein